MKDSQQSINRRRKAQENIINMDNILNAEIIENPWPYAIIENPIGNINFANPTGDSNSSYIIWLNNIHDIFYDNIENILNKYRFDRGGYESQYKDEYYIDWALQVQAPNQKSEIHVDSGRKLWSLVIYLFPNESTGTGIYDEDKNFLHHIEWKQNRGLAFCSQGPSDKHSVTWHDYGNPNS
jgi:hypothetical protein